MTKIPPLKDLIKGFDYVNPNITVENFPVPEEIGTDFKLFHFDRYISSDNAIKEMEKEGYKPARLYELLTWKDWNDKDWIVALGSVCEVDGDRRVPCLSRYDSERRLSLDWWGGDWYAFCRFLAVRNGSRKLGSSESPSTSVSLALGHLDAALEIITKAKKLLEK